ncbi:MAG: MrtP family glutamic-type intramembrane protease [Myxococcota bacterium]|nr:MrtP family glutamic-type intramembrane protease [Myxococcota bacterium]
MRDASEGEESRRGAADFSAVGWRIPLLLFAATVVWSVLLGLLQGVIPWLGAVSLGLVALAFIYLPTEHLWRVGVSAQILSLPRDWPTQRQALSLAVKTSLIVFPLYLFAFHGWQRFQGRQLHLDAERLHQWGESLRDAPPIRTLSEGEIRAWGWRDQLHFSWRLHPGEEEISLRWRGASTTEKKLKWAARSRSTRLQRTHRLSQSLQVGADAPLELALSGGRNGWARLSGVGLSGTLSVEIDGVPLEPISRLRLGALRSEGEAPLHFERNLWWVLSTLLIQLCLIAYPEELFYRGYLQPALELRFGRRRKLWGADFNWAAVGLTSLLFALAHFATIPSPGRLAVFFPSLLFGWLRARSGGILAPLLFHALCNLLLQLISPLYGS